MRSTALIRQYVLSGVATRLRLELRYPDLAGPLDLVILVWLDDRKCSETELTEMMTSEKGEGVAVLELFGLPAIIRESVSLNGVNVTLAIEWVERQLYGLPMRGVTDLGFLKNAAEKMDLTAIVSDTNALARNWVRSGNEVIAPIWVRNRID